MTGPLVTWALLSSKPLISAEVVAEGEKTLGRKCPFSVILQGQNHTLCLPGLSKMESHTPDTSLAMMSAGIMYACVLFAWCVKVSREWCEKGGCSQGQGWLG